MLSKYEKLGMLDSYLEIVFSNSKEEHSFKDISSEIQKEVRLLAIQDLDLLLDMEGLVMEGAKKFIKRMNSKMNLLVTHFTPFELEGAEKGLISYDQQPEELVEFLQVKSLKQCCEKMIDDKKISKLLY